MSWLSCNCWPHAYARRCLVCSAPLQVCAHMLRLVQLQAPPPPPPPSPGPEPADPPTGPLATTPSGAAPSSSSNNPLPASPRSITFSGGGAASGGHRSFREYITHQMASFSGHRSPRNMAAAAAAAVAEVEAEEAAAASSAATRKLQGQTDADGSSPKRGPPLAPAYFGPAAGGQMPETGMGARAGGQGAAAAAAVVCNEDMCTVQDALMAWTSALVRADVFHNASELQVGTWIRRGVVYGRQQQQQQQREPASGKQLGWGVSQRQVETAGKK